MYKKILTIMAVVLMFSVFNPQETQATRSEAPSKGREEVISHTNPNLGKKIPSMSAADLANAKPLPLGSISQESSDSSAGAISRGSGTAHYSKPAKPGGVIQNINISNTSGINATPYIRSQYPPLYSKYTENANINIYPINTIGVLFFTQNTIQYRCSAVLVYQNVVWTSGRCIHDGSGSDNGWSDNFVFYPAWSSGENPLYGSYNNWTKSFTGSGWFSGNVGYDYGAVVFDDSVGSAYPGDTLGYMGFQTGQSEAQSWKVYGYPAEAPYSGNGLYTCLTALTQIDTSVLPNTVGFGCDLPGGMTGAPLIRRFAYNGGWVNGNYSYQYPQKTRETFSPYFGDEVWSVFCEAIKSDVNVTPPTGC